MPVEIKEMLIKAVVKGQSNASTSELVDNILERQRGEGLSQAQREEIIEECIQRVLRELERKMLSR
jgi:hypothetical protein